MGRVGRDRVGKKGGIDEASCIRHMGRWAKRWMV